MALFRNEPHVWHRACKVLLEAETATAMRFAHLVVSMSTSATSTFESMSFMIREMAWCVA